ncbi:MAG: ABC transporter substrate-binding protein [Aeromicrobium sp.]
MKTTIAAVAALMLSLAACGGSDSGSGSDSSGSIKIMQIAAYESQSTSLPFMKTAAQAAVDEVNAAGGIGGRKIELLTCNDKYDPNESLRCAQKAVQEDVVAVVGSLTGFGAQVLPILEQAKIPSIGADAITAYDAQSPMSFLLDAGVPGYAAMPAVAKKNLGATKIITMHIENPSAETNQDFFKEGSELAGTEIVDNITVPLDTIDYTQYVAKAEAAGAEAIVSSMSNDSNLKLWKALGSTKSDLKVVVSIGSVSPELIKQTNGAADGSYVISGTPYADPSNETGKAFLDAMKKYQPEETVFAGVSVRAYAAVKLFADVAGTIEGDVDSASVLEAFQQVKDKKFLWIDSLSFDKDGPIKSLPRVVASVTFPSVVKDGAFVPEEPFDPFVS